MSWPSAPELSPVQALAPDRGKVMSPEILSTGTILLGLVLSVGVHEKRTTSLVMATEAIPKPPAFQVTSMEVVPVRTPEEASDVVPSPVRAPIPVDNHEKAPVPDFKPHRVRLTP